MARYTNPARRVGRNHEPRLASYSALNASIHSGTSLPALLTKGLTAVSVISLPGYGSNKYFSDPVFVLRIQPGRIIVGQQNHRHAVVILALKVPVSPRRQDRAALNHGL